MKNAFQAFRFCFSGSLVIGYIHSQHGFQIPEGEAVMKRDIFRRTLTVFLLLVLVSMTGCPSISAAEGETLPLNYLEGGKPPKAGGWTFNEEGPVSYELFPEAFRHHFSP